MLEAQFNITITYQHIKGKDNTLADALSRAHLSTAMNNLAALEINKRQLSVINPCLFVFETLNESILL